MCTCSRIYLRWWCGGRLRAQWERGAEALLWPNGVEWDAEGRDLTAWLRRGMRGQKTDAAKWCSMLHGREVRQKALLLESRGRWVVRVVERRCVVVLPGLFRPWG